jgi:hypothetical protein
MTNVSMALKLSASADDVWGVIGGFNTLDTWHPAIVSCESDGNTPGCMRTLTVPDGAQVIERLDAIDDGARSYTYSITDSPLPVEDYSATIKVVENDDSSELQWSSDFEPSGVPEADAAGIIEGIYQAGFDALTDRFGA